MTASDNGERRLLYFIFLLSFLPPAARRPSPLRIYNFRSSVRLNSPISLNTLIKNQSNVRAGRRGGANEFEIHSNEETGASGGGRPAMHTQKMCNWSHVNLINLLNTRLAGTQSDWPHAARRARARRPSRPRPRRGERIQFADYK